jgi:ketosteroid isomerase-like protein
MWQGAMDGGVKEAKLETVELTPMGEKTACEIGKYTLKIEPEEGVTVTDTGNYMVIWKHTVNPGNWILTSGTRT